MKSHRLIQSIIVLCMASMLHTPIAFAQKATSKADGLDAAVAKMRNINPDVLDAEGKNAATERLDEAWRALMAAGDRGRERVLQEIRQIDQDKAKDDYFKIDASLLLWVGWKFESADAIAEIWRTTPIEFHHEQVFHVAFEAARKRDPRALPIMKALLGNDRITLYIPQHAMKLDWPLTMQFIWGAYGPKGRAELLKVLESTTNPITQHTCIILLSDQMYLKALPAIRNVAKNGTGKAKIAAIQVLGAFGHPQDREFLLEGLKSKDSKTLREHISALAAYGDMSTASEVARQLSHDDPEIRQTAIVTLAYLTSVDAIRALHDHAKSTKSEDEREYCEKIIEKCLQFAGIDYDALMKLPKDEADQRLLNSNPAEAEYRPQPDDRTLTHDELREACRDWYARNRITGGPFAWVESRHVLAVATPKDMKRLLMVRAAALERLSDECLYEVRILDGLLLCIGRMRYRAEPGVCLRVLPKSSGE